MGKGIVEVGCREELIHAMSNNRRLMKATIKLRGTNFTLVMTGGTENEEGHIKAIVLVEKSAQKLWRK